ILYHFGEGFATSPVDQFMNHGYLAVDFFFVLSGFVLGYAYDRRMASGQLKAGSFMMRRVIRLHPMVILSVILGAVAYLIQGSVKWDGTPVALPYLLGALALGLFLIPTLPAAGVEVRGNGEMFPLNGPSWSLFFEYIGSILYAIWLHRLGRRALWIVTIVSGLGLAAILLGNLSGYYTLGVGWTMAAYGFVGGFLRLSFSFSVGLLMSRCIRPREIRGAFWICSVMIVAVLSVPYVTPDGEPSVLNAIYDGICTLIIFPAIVWIGACGRTTDRLSTATCTMLGELSYPIYIVHYPLMYLFYGWLWTGGYGFDRALPVCIGIFAAILLLAWVAMRYYDTPVRAYLTRHLTSRSK
ncbi:MAG: acyltransferase, partial [Duncaniella sp.]|nr:acyltransferase [Duncaniella sp.]